MRGRFEVPHVAAGQRLLRRLKLVSGHRTRRSRGLAFREDFHDGGMRRVTLHTRLATERAADATEIEARPRAVREAFRLAQILVDAARELAAQRGVQSDERVVTRGRSRRTEM